MFLYFRDTHQGRTGQVPQGGEKYLITFYINVFLKSTQQMTDVLQNLNQHQHSVFLRTIYSIPKRATSLIYIYIYIYIYTGWNDSHFLVHQMAWVTFGHLCKKAQKCVKSWKGNTALKIYVSLMQRKFVTVLSITSNIFWETEVEILG